MIYLDNSATTIIKPPSVKKAMLYALDNLGNPSRGAYPASLNALKAVYDAREKTAELFGAFDSSMVAFTLNITESLNICANLLVKKGDKVLTTIYEHNSLLRPLYKNEADLQIVKLTDKGEIDYGEIEEGLSGGAKAVFCAHASNLTGDIIDIKTIGRLCKKYNAYFVLDSAQTAGVLDINMKDDNIDLLCFTGHKSLFGPQGVGGVCVGEGIQIKPLKVGGSGINSFDHEHPKFLPEALEAGTPNIPAICGLSAGIDFINETTMEKIRNHETLLMERLSNGIQHIPQIKMYGGQVKNRTPVVTFNIGLIDSRIVAEELWERGEIAVRSGAHCSPLFHEYLKTDKQGAVRMSISYFNTEHEIDKVIATIRDICEYAKNLPQRHLN